MRRFLILPQRREGFRANDDGGASLPRRRDCLLDRIDFAGCQEIGARDRGGAGVSDFAVQVDDAVGGVFGDETDCLIDLLRAWGR